MIYIRLTFSQKPAVPASESVSEKSSFFFSVLLIFSNSCPGLVGSGLLGGFTDRYCSRLSREDISGDVEGMVSSGRRTAAASKGIVSVLSKDFEASFVSFSPANTINSEQVLKNTWKISGDTTKIKSHNHTVIAILYRTWMHIKKKCLHSCCGFDGHCNRWCRLCWWWISSLCIQQPEKNIFIFSKLATASFDFNSIH